MGIDFGAPGTGFLGPKLLVLLGGAIEHTGRLLRMLPGVSRELS